MAHKGHHQDYVARIRYTNALPPPPFAPKLLEIANDAVASGQYTSPSFGSRLFRDQPLNVEADAELGMRIDLVGLRGVFEGDENVIMFPEKPAPIDPRDRALLRPLSALGKFAAADASTVSFLRRTEYLTGREKSAPAGNAALLRANNALRTKPRSGPGSAAGKPTGAAAATAASREALRNDRAAMVRAVEKSFNLAHPADAYTGPDTAGRKRGDTVTPAERALWDRPVHPSNPSLRVLDAYDFIPDLAALGDSGGYMLLKYNGHPTGEAGEGYDARIDHLLLRPAAQTAEQLARFEADREAHLADPLARPGPIGVVDFDAYAPRADALPALKRKLDVYDADRDDPSLYSDGPSVEGGDRFFRFERVRELETFKQTGDRDQRAQWNNDVAVALHDGAAPGPAFGGSGPAPARRQKAAYAYPIMQRTSVRPKRDGMSKYGMRGARRARGEEAAPDVFEVTVGEMDAKKVREALRSYGALAKGGSPPGSAASASP